MFELLFRDEKLCVLNKPAGHVVHKTRGAGDSPALVQGLRDQLGHYVYPVHRLDRGTSGCIVFSFDSSLVAKLQTSLREGSKKYTGLCLGRLLDKKGRIDRELTGENKKKQMAVTNYKVVREFEDYSLLELAIETGRKHQIRRHLSFLGHHLIGDVNYGKGWLNRRFREEFDLHRLFLHCHHLSLLHPLTGRQLSVSALLPNELQQVLDRLP